ncbi:enhanced serine sensitivity protein SseB [Paenibacillus macerans]|uniref:enhanced serine sensitivity protein SseB n=1 Tax=Paenibacillus macerans TaxID=44252 RepID=UPI003D31D5A2
MNEERKDEIGRKFILTPEVSAEELGELEIQELIFLVHAAKRFKAEEAFPEVYLDERIKVFVGVLHDKIKAAEALYLAYDKATGYPYVDGDERVWMFSQEAYAANVEDYFRQQLLMLEMKQIGGEDVLKTFGQLHILGLPKVLVDNGQYHIEIGRDDILPPPDWTGTPEISIPVTNPGLQRAMIHFFQYLHAPTGDKEAKQRELNALEAQMLDEVLQARYLLPMQLKESDPSPADEQGVKTLKQGTVIQFGVLNAEDDSAWLPAFTDWPEFEKVYDKTAWSSNIAAYDDLLAVSGNMSGVVINCRGIPLRIDEKNQAMIEAYRQERSRQPDAETVQEVVVPKETRILLGIPKVYPEAMIEAVKTYMKTQKAVKEAYLRQMAREQETSYLLIVDLDGSREEIFNGIAAAASPHLNGMPLDLVDAKDGDWAGEVRSLKPFYKKKRFGLL